MSSDCSRLFHGVAQRKVSSASVCLDPLCVTGANRWQSNIEGLLVFSKCFRAGFYSFLTPLRRVKLAETHEVENEDLLLTAICNLRDTTLWEMFFTH